MKISSFTHWLAQEFVILTTSGVASDEDFAKIMTFLF